MNVNNIPFQLLDWEAIPKIEHKGESGTSFWQTAQFEGLTIRVVEYSPVYMANHWCQKGHIVYCLGGEFAIEHNTGEKLALTEGATYVVSDDVSSHRSVSEKGAKLLIIDGDFLRA